VTLPLVYNNEEAGEPSEEIIANSYENCSSKFYKEHSAADMGDLRERQQRWIEAKFKEADDDEETHLFIDQKFDSFFKDFSLSPDNKTVFSSFKKEGGEQGKNEFSREDLNQASDTKTGDNYSVNTDKGSEIGCLKDTPIKKYDNKNISSFWKRVDMREKKVIRGLCGLSKDYFRGLIDGKKTIEDIFQSWKESFNKNFLDLDHTSLLELIGQASVMSLSWKFAEKVRACKLFTEEEKQVIVKSGKEFKEQRNNCSSSRVRKDLLSGLVVRIGKLLYSSSLT
jgi:hypothetical protein